MMKNFVFCIAVFALASCGKNVKNSPSACAALEGVWTKKAKVTAQIGASGAIVPDGEVSYVSENEFKFCSDGTFESATDISFVEWQPFSKQSEISEDDVRQSYTQKYGLKGSFLADNERLQLKIEKIALADGVEIPFEKNAAQNEIEEVQILRYSIKGDTLSMFSKGAPVSEYKRKPASDFSE